MRPFSHLLPLLFLFPLATHCLHVSVPFSSFSSALSSATTDKELWIDLFVDDESPSPSSSSCGQHYAFPPNGATSTTVESLVIRGISNSTTSSESNVKFRPFFSCNNNNSNSFTLSISSVPHIRIEGLGFQGGGGGVINSGGALQIVGAETVSVIDCFFANNTAFAPFQLGSSGGGGAITWLFEQSQLSSSTRRSSKSNEIFERNNNDKFNNFGIARNNDNANNLLDKSSPTTRIALLNLTGSIFLENRAIDDGGGGAVLMAFNSAVENYNISVIGGSFENNSASGANGGGALAIIFTDSGTNVDISIRDGIFSRNSALVGPGGGIAIRFLNSSSPSQILTVTSTSFIMDKCSLLNNNAIIGGGAIAFHVFPASMLSSVVIQSSQFSYNSNVFHPGGAVDIWYNSTTMITTFLISNSNFTSNRCLKSSGGAVGFSLDGQSDFLTVTITADYGSRTSFINNYAHISGGGMDLVTVRDCRNSSVTVGGGEGQVVFSGNTVSEWGGGGGLAIAFLTAIFDTSIRILKQSIFTENKCIPSGSGGSFDLYVFQRAENTSVVFQDTEHINNVASGANNWGGAIFIGFSNQCQSTAITVMRSNFTGNSNVGGYGGGAIAVGFAPGAHGVGLQISNCTFNRNTANSTVGGGAVYVSLGERSDNIQISVTDSVFEENAALSTQGGAMLMNIPTGTGSIMMYRCWIFRNSASGGGGGVGIYRKTSE